MVQMSNAYLQRSYFFLRFLLDFNSTKLQKRFILQNLSKYQLQSIIEILYNLFLNKNIKYSQSLTKIIKQHQNIFNKLFLSKRYSTHKKFIKKHHKIIFNVLYKAKGVIEKILSPQ
jgi:hypothetical protein